MRPDPELNLASRLAAPAHVQYVVREARPAQPLRRLAG